MADNWDDVASAMNARMAELRITQLELAARSKISPATIREIQHNHRPRQRFGRTLAALSEALEWPPDYLDNVLKGAPTAGLERPDERDADLAAIRAELAALAARIDDLERRVPPAP